MQPTRRQIARGRPEQARQEAQRAIDLLSELKAELEVARARALLTTLPASVMSGAELVMSSPGTLLGFPCSRGQG